MDGKRGNISEELPNHASTPKQGARAHTYTHGAACLAKNVPGGALWGGGHRCFGLGGRTPAHVFLILSISYLGGGGARDSYAKAALGN